MSGNAMEAKRRKSRRPAVITRTLDALAALGYELAAKVETFNPHTMTRADLFGLADVLAVGERGHLYVQVCMADLSAHKKKYEDPVLARRLRLLVSSPKTEFQIWAWRELAVKKKDGTRAVHGRWTPRILTAFIEDGEMVWLEDVNGC